MLRYVRTKPLGVEMGSMAEEAFVRTQVATQNFIIDFLQRIRNFVGWRQRAYEEMIEETSQEILANLEGEYEIDWYRVDVDMMGMGSMSVTVYGQGVPK